MNLLSSNNRPPSQDKRPSRMPAMALSLAILGFALILTAGCGPKAPKLSSSDMTAFDSAPAEAKQTWEKALAADKANDYVNAASLLNNLEQIGSLSDPQKQALETERAAFGQRLMQAVDKNDPAAIKAVQNSATSRNAPKR